jgi:hypothetical protein
MTAPRPTFDRGHERQPDLFLSHSSTDKAFVRTLPKDLSSVGVDVWFDELETHLVDQSAEPWAVTLVTVIMSGGLQHQNDTERNCMETLLLIRRAEHHVTATDEALFGNKAA